MEKQPMAHKNGQSEELPKPKRHGKPYTLAATCPDCGRETQSYFPDGRPLAVVLAGIRAFPPTCGPSCPALVGPPTRRYRVLA